MSAAIPITAAVGLGTLIGGAFLGGNAAKKRQQALRGIANTPGVSLGDVYGDALGSNLQALPMAQDLISASNRFNAAELDSLLESSLPGLKGMQAQRAGNIGSFLRGELPEDVSRSVFRGSTGRALEGGFGGSPAGRNLVARDLGRTSLDLMAAGGRELDSALRSAPLPNILSTQDVLDIGPQDTLGLRERQRALRIEGLMEAANAPGRSDVWAKALQQMGSSMLGAGGGFGSFAGMMGGGGGG